MNETNKIDYSFVCERIKIYELIISELVEKKQIIEKDLDIQNNILVELNYIKRNLEKINEKSKNES